MTNFQYYFWIYYHIFNPFIQQKINSIHHCGNYRGACVLSHVRLFVTPWIVTHQALLSMEFSRQEYWSG